MTDLSIIIVSFKGWVRLTKCLEALNSFTGKSLKAEVIVVDNRSEDETIYELENKFPKFRFIHNSVNGGFSNGCNLGAKNSAGKFLLFLNPITAEQELEKLVHIAEENEKLGVISCRQVNEKGKESVASGPFPQLLNLTGFQRSIIKILTPHTSSLTPLSSLLTPDLTYPDWISGSVVLIRKEFFEKIKGFDEDFWMYFEDVDLCRRVTNAGFRVALCRNITIEHNHGGSSRINIKTASLTKTEVHISRHVYISKHKRGFEKLIIQSFLILNNIISGGLMAVPGLVFFFIPKVFSRVLIFLKLIKYYIGSLLRYSWISPRSVNFQKKRS
jgi:GT2 family glycosyltransferase